MVYQGGLNATNIFQASFKTPTLSNFKQSLFFCFFAKPFFYVFKKASQIEPLFLWPGTLSRVIEKKCGVAIKITAFVQSSINPLLNIAFYQKKPLYVLLNSMYFKSAWALANIRRFHFFYCFSFCCDCAAIFFAKHGAAHRMSEANECALGYL